MNNTHQLGEKSTGYTHAMRHSLLTSLAISLFFVPIYAFIWWPFVFAPLIPISVIFLILKITTPPKGLFRTILASAIITTIVMLLVPIATFIIYVEGSRMIGQPILLP